jgi:hypothetical protein
MDNLIFTVYDLYPTLLFLCRWCGGTVQSTTCISTMWRRKVVLMKHCPWRRVWNMEMRILSILSISRESSYTCLAHIVNGWVVCNVFVCVPVLCSECMVSSLWVLHALWSRLCQSCHSMTQANLIPDTILALPFHSIIYNSKQVHANTKSASARRRYSSWSLHRSQLIFHIYNTKINALNIEQSLLFN